MRKILTLAGLLLIFILPAHAQNDEAFAEKFATAWCKCTDKNIKKLSPALKQIAVNAVKNPITDTTANFQPYFDYLAQNPNEKKLESEATDKIALCTTKAFKSEIKQKKEASFFVMGLLSNNKSISKRTKHNDMAYFYYCIVFKKLIKEYNIPIQRNKE